MRARIEKAAAAVGAPDRAEALAIRQVRETRRALERGWLAASDALRSQGKPNLADQTRRFVHSMLPARTEREWLRADSLQRTQRQHQREAELAR